MSDPSTPGTFRLFVYGTLKRDGCRFRILRRQRFLGECRTAPHYDLYDLGRYPGLRESGPDGRHVYGELYEVEESLRRWLDDEEGAPSLFRMEPIELEGHDGPVLAYFYQQDINGRPRVPTGRWNNQD